MHNQVEQFHMNTYFIIQIWEIGLVIISYLFERDTLTYDNIISDLKWLSLIEGILVWLCSSVMFQGLWTNQTNTEIWESDNFCDFVLKF